jgi:hypothetical protein
LARVAGEFPTIGFEARQLMLSLRIFISSPSDVGSERAVAIAVSERLQLEFKGLVKLDVYLWERSLMLATETFQSQIMDIKDADLAIFILWARVGTPLPIDQFRRPDGSGYASGTEYEFEQARDSFDRRRRPEILCYLKDADVPLSLRYGDRRERQLADVAAIRCFVDKWFRSADGSYKSAFRTFENPAQFEDLLETHMRAWIRNQLRVAEPAVANEPVWRGSPFRGLKIFDFEHALIYCGRTGLVTAALEALRKRGAENRGFLMVIGVSGVGKSSLVRAGMLPLLMRPRVVENVATWRRATYLPNGGQYGLVRGFAAALSDEHAVPELAQNAVEEGASVEELLGRPVKLALALNKTLDRVTIRERERNPNVDTESVAKLFILVDQFEEIFDETITRDERIKFVDALTTMVHTGRVWIVVTLRADFFSRCGELPERFRDLYIEAGGIFTLGGPRAAEIAQIIRRPALLAGLQFERAGDPEEGLDDVLCDAASGNPMTLPLLEFTLDELWRRSGDLGTLRFSDYMQLGGLSGALKLRAEEEFSSLPLPVQASLPYVLAALVHTDSASGDLILQSRIAISQFAATSGSKALIDAFVSARLMVADHAPDDTPVVGLAHEALLREWPPAVDWIAENRGSLRLRSGISAAAALWRDSDYPGDRLLGGALLKDARKLLNEHAELLGPEDRYYIERSIEASLREKRQRVRSFVFGGVAAAIFLLAVVTGPRTLSHALSLVSTVPLVWGEGTKVPIPETSISRLRSSIASLSSHLDERTTEIESQAELVPWTVAQIWTSLDGLDPSLRSKASKLRQFMTRNEVECTCWRETLEQQPNSIVTAWVLSVLARYGQAATRAEIEYVLQRQGAAGWWSMFPSTQDDGNASTSATAMTALALYDQLVSDGISRDQQKSVKESIDRATGWLKKRVLPREARWKEYPPDHPFEKDVDYEAVSALVISALRKIANSNEFDREWLDELRPDVPTVQDIEVAKGFVFGQSKGAFLLDQVRHYKYPWMLRATVDAYANGNLWGRTRGAVWIRHALERPLSPTDFLLGGSQFQDWAMAEVLIALRHALYVLDGSSKRAAEMASAP